MALIYVYDATELDQQQISDALKGTDHHWEYVDDKIGPANLNPDTEVISVFVTSIVSREIIEKLPKLKLIACRSTGFNNVDLQAAKEHGITVTNVPTYGENTVAEYAFSLLLALTRRLPAVLEAENHQVKPEDLRGRDLEGLTFGVVGAGHIGQKALKIAAGFSMKTLAYDSFPKPELEKELGFKYASIDDLLAQSDIVSVHAPYLPSTHHIMSADRLAKMKPGAILINTARGELVDTSALIEQLDSGHLGGAAIDVVEGEALLNYNEETALLRSDTIPEDLLRHSVEIGALSKMPNVIISPHNAFNTAEAIGRINKTTAQNMIDFWYDKIPNKVEIPKKPVGKLLIARHTESEWNASGRWTGTRDAHLSDKGFKEAAQFGRALKKLGVTVDVAYCSQQIRSRETLEGMLSAADQFGVQTIVDGAINERDYGEYTGKNKWDMRDLIGEDAFDKIRRGWDVPVPGGETLKQVYERVVPFYKEKILPQLMEGKNILIVAHGNSLRALIKYLETISDEGISDLEMMFGEIVIYDVGKDGLKVGSTVAKITGAPPHA